MTKEKKLADLIAQRAAIDAQIEAVKAEPDYERYREMLVAFYVGSFGKDQSSTPMDAIDLDNIRGALAVRNHDPDVIELVRFVRRHHDADGAVRCTMERPELVLAPFAAIKDE